MAESKVKRENYLTIQGWMITDLALKGNELLIYACIYGFCQKEDQSFTGGLKYLADWVSSTKQTALRCLQSLVSKGLLEKVDHDVNGVRICEYRCKNDNGALPKSQQGCYQNDNGGIVKIVTNNIPINNNDNKLNNKDNAGVPTTILSHPPDKKPKERNSAIDTGAIFRRYTLDEKVLSLLHEWLKVRKAKRAPETEKALILNLERLSKLSEESGMSQAEYLEAVIARGWAAFYSLNNWNRPAPTRQPVKTEAAHAAGGHPSGFGW